MSWFLHFIFFTAECSLSVTDVCHIHLPHPCTSIIEVLIVDRVATAVAWPRRLYSILRRYMLVLTNVMQMTDQTIHVAESYHWYEWWQLHVQSFICWHLLMQDWHYQQYFYLLSGICLADNFHMKSLLLQRKPPGCTMHWLLSIKLPVNCWQHAWRSTCHGEMFLSIIQSCYSLYLEGP